MLFSRSNQISISVCCVHMHFFHIFFFYHCNLPETHLQNTICRLRECAQTPVNVKFTHFQLWSECLAFVVGALFSLFLLLPYFSVYMRVWLVSIGWLFMFRSHFFMLKHRDDSLHCKTEICFDLVFSLLQTLNNVKNVI